MDKISGPLNCCQMINTDQIVLSVAINQGLLSLKSLELEKINSRHGIALKMGRLAPIYHSVYTYQIGPHLPPTVHLSDWPPSTTHCTLIRLAPIYHPMYTYQIGPHLPPNVHLSDWPPSTTQCTLIRLAPIYHPMYTYQIGPHLPPNVHLSEPCWII